MRRHTTTPSPGAPRAAAFSIPELMITLGILGVGLTLVAGTFPVAVRENGESANNTMGTIMCRNALAIVRARLRHRDPQSGIGTEFRQIGNPGPFQEVPANRLGGADLSYPIVLPTQLPADATRGCVVLGKSLHAERNDYLLVFVACQFAAGHSPTARKLEGMTSVGKNSDEFQVSAGQSDWLQLGSPVIAPNGRYARIIRVEGERAAVRTVKLDRALDDAPVNNPFVITEVTAGGTPVGSVSPAMFVMATRTGLRENEQ